MKYELGDRVRIIANGQTGSICDAEVVDGRPCILWTVQVSVKVKRHKIVLLPWKKMK